MTTVRRITADEAKRLCDEEGYVFLDVRTEAEFAAGHPKGSHNVPFLFATSGGAQPNPGFADEVSRLYDKARPIVVSCKSGARSLKAAEVMAALGFSRVVELRAGWDGARSPFGQLVEEGWLAKGYPVALGADEGAYVALLGGSDGAKR